LNLKTEEIKETTGQLETTIFGERVVYETTISSFQTSIKVQETLISSLQGDLCSIVCKSREPTLPLILSPYFYAQLCYLNFKNGYYTTKNSSMTKWVKIFSLFFTSFLKTFYHIMNHKCIIFDAKCISDNGPRQNYVL